MNKNVVRTMTMAIALGLTVALAIWLLSRPVAPAGQNVSTKELLRCFPAPAGESAGDCLLSKTLAATAASPEDPAKWIGIGNAYAQKIRERTEPRLYHFAEGAYRQALKLDPVSVDARTGMAWSTGGRHQFDKSAAWAYEALKLDPENADAHGILGDAAMELGDYEATFEYYQKMMDLRPDLSSWSRGATLLWITGDEDGAISLMERAINAGGPFAENTAWCRSKLAMMRFSQGNLSLASQALEPVLQTSSNYRPVLLAAARISAARDEQDAAIAFYQRMLEAGPDHDAFAGLGDLHASRGEMDAADGYYQKVELLHSSNRAAAVHDHMQIARFYADHGQKLAEALHLAEQHKDSRNVFESDTLAWVYLKSGNLTAAQAMIKRALAHNTPDVETIYHAGMIEAAAGNSHAASGYLRRALEKNPNFHPIQAPIARKILESLASPAVAETRQAPEF